MKHKKVAPGFALSGIVAMAVALFMVGCGDPKVRIRSSRDQEGRLIVDLKPGWRVNSIYDVSFRLEGDDENLWSLMECWQVRRIVYGEIPVGASQRHPADNVPPKPLPSSGILHVGVLYQWDSAIPPAPVLSSCTVKLLLTEDGGVKILGDKGLIEPKRSKAPESPSSRSGESH